MNPLLCLVSILILHTSTVFGQSLAPEDGSVRISKWYYNPAVLAVKDLTSFFNILTDLGVTPIEIKNVGGFVQDTLFFDTKGNRLLKANLSDVATRNSGQWTDSVWDYEHDGMRSYKGPVPQANDRQLSWFLAEGGATISGTDSNGRPYLITTQNAYDVVKAELRYQFVKNNKLWPTQQELFDNWLKEREEIEAFALKKAPEPSKLEILSKISADLDVDVENIFIVETQFLHLDVVMLPLGGKKIVLNSVEESALQIQQLGLPVGTSSTVISSENVDKDGLNKLALQLKSAGFEVIRAAGIWTLPDGRSINLFNGFQGLSKNNKRFLITNSAYEFLKAETYFTTVLKNSGFNGEIYYFGKYHPFAGIDCMGAISP